MTEKEFIEQAKEFGYSDERIQELLDLQKERGLAFEKIALFEQNYI